MNKLIFIILPIVLFSCNTARQNTYENTENNTDSLLTAGEHEIEIDGVKLWYLVRGNGPVLIVYPSSAGWGGDCTVYTEYLKPLEDYRTIIYLEPRGLGKSQRMDSLSDYTPEKYLQEFEHFRKKMGIDTFDLFGHCYAGTIAMLYALNYQEHLNSLILFSTFPRMNYGVGMAEWSQNRDGFEDFQKRQVEIEEEGLSGIEKFKEATKNEFQLYLNDYSKHKEKINQILDATVFSLTPQEAVFMEAAHYNIVDSLSNINTRTLILYGDDDFPHVVLGSKEIHEEILNSSLIEIKNSAHWACIDQSETFFNETINFLDN